MPSNLRSKPIEGHITDSAGNVIRNSLITIKTPTPSGNYSVDTIKSDDEGYFVSKPLPNGSYDLYESGIAVARIIHRPDITIQPYKADKENYFIKDIFAFSDLLKKGQLNKFKVFLQIESNEIDVSTYGNTYPLMNFIYSSNSLGVESDLYYMSKFYNIANQSISGESRSDGRFTTTRFDVEYFSPLTSMSTTYKRIRWAGIPAIRFKKDSKLIVPLDYFSIVATIPKFISNNELDFTTETVNLYLDESDNIIKVSGSGTYAPYNEFFGKVFVGDIVKLNSFSENTWYGIVLKKEIKNSVNIIHFEKWKSSRFTSGSYEPSSTYKNINIMYLYDGMFNGLSLIDQLTLERFYITENINYQDSNSELYSYVNADA